MTGILQHVVRRHFMRNAVVVALLLGIKSITLSTGAAESIRPGQSASQTSGEGNRPHGPQNILFIVTDQEKYFKKYPKGLDLEAREWLQESGVTFNNHYIAAVMCTSSRAVIYTGQHVPNNGMFDNSELPWVKSMSPDIPTIGDKMREAGYYTAYTGKWHLTKEFEAEGSDKNFTNAMEKYGFSDYNPVGDMTGKLLQGYYDDGLIAEEAIHWLRSKGEELRQKKQPWFLAVNFINPHDIMYGDADPPGVGEQDNGNLAMRINRPPRNQVYQKTWDYPLPKSLSQSLDEKGRPKAHKEYYEAWNAILGRIPDNKKNWKRFNDYYFNCIKDVDNQMLRLLREVEDLGLADNTVIVFTSDHGEMGGVHGKLRGKGPTAYEENIHVPLVIVRPGGPRGKECNALTSHVDILPSMVGFSGAPPKKKASMTAGLPGHDLSVLLDDPEEADIHAIRNGALFVDDQLLAVDAEFITKAFQLLAQKNGEEKLKKSGLKIDLMKRGNLRTLIDGRYKFSRYFAPKQHNSPETWEELLSYNDIELFDLKKDPHEMHNLAAEAEKHEELIMSLNKKLNKLIYQEIGRDVGQELPGSEESYVVGPRGVD